MIPGHEYKATQLHWSYQTKYRFNARTHVNGRDNTFYYMAKITKMSLEYIQNCGDPALVKNPQILPVQLGTPL